MLIFYKQPIHVNIGRTSNNKPLPKKNLEHRSLGGGHGPPGSGGARCHPDRGTAFPDGGAEVSMQPEASSVYNPSI
jgi:hypothetical protein